MKPEWSLEDELKTLSGGSSLEEAVKSLALVPSGTMAFAIESLGEWQRAGSETYTYRFRISSGSSFLCDYILKACVVFSSGRSPDVILDDWLGRRALVQAFGIDAPILFGRGQGIILEEYIQQTVKEQISKGWPGGPSALVTELSRYAATLAALGFAPIEAFADLRTRYKDLVMVDFGEDLGSPDFGREVDDGFFEQALKFLESAGITVDVKLHDDFLMSFEQNKEKIANRIRREHYS